MAAECPRPPRYDFATPPSAGRRHLSLGKHSGFRLECGKALPDVVVAYETYGSLNATCDNAILVCHALTGDSHVTAHHELAGEAPGWWDPMVGPGKPLDTNEYFVVCCNVVGGCQGSTGPWSLDPATGEPYGAAFPMVTVRDMVRLERALMDHLGVKRLACAIGGSMGGMQVLEWALTYPDMVDAVVPIAACGRMSAQGIAYNEVQRQAIMADRNWACGNYYYGEPPSQGLAVARMMGMITYQSDESMSRKFGRGFQTDEESTLYGWDGMFKVESYLRYQGTKLVRRFDANSYVHLSRAMDLHDVSRGRGGDAAYRRVLGSITARTLVVGIDSDILFPTYQQTEIADAISVAGGTAQYSELHSPFGHDAFLIEFAALNPIVEAFLGEAPRARK